MWGGLAILAVGALFASARMTVEVSEPDLKIEWFPFLERKIPLASVRQAAPRTCQPLQEYGGWGIRSGKAGKAYSIDGDAGVQLVIEDGERVFIGSHRAADLAHILNARGVLEAQRSDP